MQIGRISNATRVCGKSQGFLGLPIRDEIVNCPVCGPETNSMVTAWIPTPEEIALIKRGAPVHVRVLGLTPLPMMVEVGEPPAED